LEKGHRFVSILSTLKDLEIIMSILFILIWILIPSFFYQPNKAASLSPPIFFSSAKDAL
jgi:hypothetical protein